MAARRSRSEAARRAAVQRSRAKSTKERAALAKKRSEAAKRGWVSRMFKARLIALGHRVTMRASNYTEWKRMNDMVKNNDPRWLQFERLMRQFGFSERRTYDQWFSPDV